MLQHDQREVENTKALLLKNVLIINSSGKVIAQPQKLCQQSHSKFYLIESSPVLGEELAGIGAASCVMGDGVCRAGLAPEGLLQRLAGHWLQASFAWMSIRDRPFVQASAAWFTVDIAEIFRSFFK